MEIIKTDIEGVVVVKPTVFEDERGYFYESYSKRLFDKLVRTVNFVQDNQSKSSYGVLRGLHYQKWPFCQSKLVRVIEGTVLDVAVDIPRGFAHGFSVLSETAVFQYKCDEFYHPESEGGVAWDDPQLNIDWRLPADKIILSEKDKHHPLLSELHTPFDYNIDLYQ